MIYAILYVSNKGWVMKFIPTPGKIVVSLYVEISGIQFTEEISFSKEVESGTELSIGILRAAARLENRINKKLNIYDNTNS